MHEEIEALRIRIDTVTRGSDGRRAFTAAIRKDVVAIAGRWKQTGRHMTALADALGLHKTTLRAWTDGPKAKRGSRPKAKRVRAVRVEADRGEQPKETTTGQLVAMLPLGIRIEGLAIADVIELAGALR